MEIAAFLYLIAIFSIILLCLWRKVSLGLTLVIASLCLALFFGVGFKNTFYAFWKTVIEKDSSGSYVTLELIGILFLIAMLEVVMRRSGIFDKMFGSIGVVIKDTRKATVFFPVFLGTLPSAGGARFSAPLTGQAAASLHLSKEKLSFINYWFRHIWEPVFPLYPGIILAAALAGVALGDFNKYQFSHFLFMLVAGWFVAFWGVPAIVVKTNKDKNAKEHLLALLEGLFPIVFIIAAVLFFGFPLIGALLIVVVSQVFIYKTRWVNLLDYIKEAFSLNIILLIYGVMLFKTMLGMSGAITDMVRFFEVIKLPILVVLFVLPFITGLLTGVVQAVVGITFPLLLPLIAVGGKVDLPLLSFAFISGYVGVLLSPVHLCYLLTCEYFGTDINRMYKYIIVLSLALPAISLILIKISQR